MIRYLFLAGYLLTSVLAKSQAPVSNFSASPVQGCTPLTVSFTDQSTGNPKFWNWDFGNGQLSSLQNPSVTYYSPGRYTVKLVVRNANGTNGITKTDYIIVNPSPTAEFSANLTLACLPATIRFTDISSDTAGNIVKWDWNFGDGTTSTLQNPTKSYSANGFYTVMLKATSSTGCTAVAAKYGYIRIVSGVKANFNYSVKGVCTPPFNTTFSNLTSGPGNISYAWNFGNGNTSTNLNPVTSFASAGSYNVQLIARSDLGCIDTLKKTIAISSTNTTFSGPDSACLNIPVTFRNTSNPAPVSSKWDFGDGTSSQQLNPSKTFTTAGNVPVKLVNTYTSCRDSVTRVIKVQAPPAIDFTSDVQKSCKAPLSVNFQDVSPDANQWLWNFGDGTTSTAKNPTHVYNTPGEFDVTLTITSAFGCKSSIAKSKFIQLIVPTVTISNAPTGGCIPFAFSPVANINAIDGISSYLWDFGEPGPGSTLPNPSYTYANTGTYTISLQITTTGGCIAKGTVVNGIRTGTPPVADFKSDTIQACTDSVIRFTNLSTPAGTSAAWDFGDGTSSTVKDPVHSYKAPGNYTVSLTSDNNGCKSTIIKNQYITVLAPLAKFDYSVDCKTKLTVAFVNQSVLNFGPVSFLWEFGDPGKSTSNAKNPSFTYPGLGTYSVRLTVTNGPCSNTVTQTLTLVSEKAALTIANPTDTVCRNMVTVFTAVGGNSQNILKYGFAFKGAPSVFTNDRFLGFYLPVSGTFEFELVVVDKNNCTDTSYKKLTILGPTASFSTSTAQACANSVVSFTDQSKPDPGTSIVKWNFEFGDGTTQSFTRPPFNHLYKDTGNFKVRLTVQDNRGCTDSISLTNMIHITKPGAAFKVVDSLFCPGVPLKFTDSSKGAGPFLYLWNFGDGGTSTLNNPTHVYPKKDTNYTVTLIIQDTLGCTDTLRKLNYIQVKFSKPAFDVKDSVTICPPLETKFTFKGKDYESFYWDFGDGVTSTLQDPVHFYNAYGPFTAKLFTVGFGGCLDSSLHTVNIYDPKSIVYQYSPITNCNSILTDYNVIPPPYTKFTFNFGDGTEDNSQKNNFQHLFKSPGIYAQLMTITDSIGCSVPVYGKDNINVLGAEPFFSADKDKFCDSGTVYFTNYTIANEPVIANVWDFGDGFTTTDIDVIHSFPYPGQYIVSLTATTQTGCTKTLTDTVRVYGTPDPNIQFDSVVCVNSPNLLKGSLSIPDTAITWNWNFGNGQSSTVQNPSVTYSKEGSYSVDLQATNAFGCKRSTSANLTVVPLPVINMPPNPVIPVGGSVQIPVTYSPNVTKYQWMPITGLNCTNCANPVAAPKLTTTYLVSVTDSNGCKNSKDITLSVLCNDNNYFIPNTFTPNGDGNNDVFYPRGTGVNHVRSMRIFNRWGEIVFEKRNFSANTPADGWNGSYKGKPAIPDAYVYFIEFICENGEIIPFKGNITLIR